MGSVAPWRTNPKKWTSCPILLSWSQHIGAYLSVVELVTWVKNSPSPTDRQRPLNLKAKTCYCTFSVLYPVALSSFLYRELCKSHDFDEHPKSLKFFSLFLFPGSLENDHHSNMCHCGVVNTQISSINFLVIKQPSFVYHQNLDPSHGAVLSFPITVSDQGRSSSHWLSKVLEVQLVLTRADSHRAYTIMLNVTHLPLFINDYFGTDFPSKIHASCLKMKASKEHKKQKLQQRGCRALCCSCRLSVSSSEEAESSNSDRFASISSLAHAMVQERLDQMIRERQETRHIERRRQRSEGTKFVVMVAMEKCSYDPREDFRESMVEMIMANRIQEPKDLRSLLNYYVSMNSEEYHGIILEVFHEVCTSLFLCCKCH
ncbi:Ovate protein family [Theobroma cacao]|nr:Ovate protein family [Theobroma cacao]